MRWHLSLQPATVRALRRVQACRRATGRPARFAVILRDMARAELARLAADHPELGELATWPDWYRPIPEDYPPAKRRRLHPDAAARRSIPHTPPAADPIGDPDDLDDTADLAADLGADALG